jgi:hypothetical protein
VRIDKPRDADLAASPGAAVAGETFQFSTDPELVAKVNDVVASYLSPRENAIVLSV